MTIIVNGEERSVRSATVAALVEELGLAGSACAAEVNGELVPRRAHAQREIREGDRVELVTLVGGG